MSRHALSYLQLTGAITPERASRIVVVSTPEGQRTPLPTRSPEQPPHAKGCNRLHSHCSTPPETFLQAPYTVTQHLGCPPACLIS